jgi:hypothetical protein
MGKRRECKGGKECKYGKGSVLELIIHQIPSAPDKCAV